MLTLSTLKCACCIKLSLNLYQFKSGWKLLSFWWQLLSFLKWTVIMVQLLVDGPHLPSTVTAGTNWHPHSSLSRQVKHQIVQWIIFSLLGVIYLCPSWSRIQKQQRKAQVITAFAVPSLWVRSTGLFTFCNLGVKCETKSITRYPWKTISIFINLQWMIAIWMLTQ